MVEMETRSQNVVEDVMPSPPQYSSGAEEETELEILEPSKEELEDSLEFNDENGNNTETKPEIIEEETIPAQLKQPPILLPPLEKPMSVSSDDGSSPRTTPSPTTLERFDSDRTDWDGLNLSLTAREVRERIGSKKKADPRKDKLDMRKKFDIIQTL